MRPEFLTRLAEADQNVQPPAALEARLRAAVRARKARSHRVAYALLAVAATVLVVALAIRKPAERVQAPSAPAIAKVEQQPAVTRPAPAPAPVVQEIAKVAPRPAPRSARRAPRPSTPSPAPQTPVERVTEFFPLTADAREIRPGSHLMRVRMPRAAMTSFGFPMEAEFSRGQINADVLVGDDGIARAIRFVHGN